MFRCVPSHCSLTSRSVFGLGRVRVSLSELVDFQLYDPLPWAWCWVLDERLLQQELKGVLGKRPLG